MFLREFVAREKRFEARLGRRERKPESYPQRYVEDFFAKSDEVAAQRSFFAAEFISGHTPTGNETINAKYKDKPVGVVTFSCEYGTNISGAASGPQSLRQSGLFELLRKRSRDVVDFGDVNHELVEQNKSEHNFINLQNNQIKNPIKNILECYTAAKLVRDKSMLCLERGLIPLILGGDHSVSIGSVSAVSNFYSSLNKNITNNIGLIWIDAHPDCNTPLTSPSHCAFGMSVAVLLGLVDGPLKNLQSKPPAVLPQNMCFIGAREIDAGERELIEKLNIKCFFMEDIRNKGIEKVVTEAIDVVTKDTAGFVCSFDLDVCDPKHVPGTGLPVDNGFSVEEALKTIEIVGASPNLLSFELVELNSRLDRNSQTTNLALKFIEKLFS